MEIELRADGVRISGYANVTEKKSRPVITRHGRVIEEIEPRAFEKALERADNVLLTKDHDKSSVLAETRAGNLNLYEDNIGLHYDATISDSKTVEEARAGKIKGLSIGMYNVQDTVETRADDIPLRKISALDLDHITLVVNRVPYYASTSLELRANDETAEIEIRAFDDTPRVNEIQAKKQSETIDYSEYENRIKNLKSAK